jgi:hypothetical protein
MPARRLGAVGAIVPEFPAPVLLLVPRSDFAIEDT